MSLGISLPCSIIHPLRTWVRLSRHTRKKSTRYRCPCASRRPNRASWVLTTWSKMPRNASASLALRPRAAKTALYAFLRRVRDSSSSHGVCECPLQRAPRLEGTCRCFRLMVNVLCFRVSYPCCLSIASKWFSVHCSDLTEAHELHDSMEQPGRWRAQSGRFWA